MSNNNGNVVKRRGNKTSNNNQNLRRNVRSSPSVHMLNGGKFIPSDDPPVITACPWNTVTIDTTVSLGKTLGYFKQSDMLAVCINQLGFLDSNVHFEYRLLSCSLWAYSSTKSDYFRISVFPMSMVGSRGIELTRLESNAVKNKFAKVGYHYPLNHTSLVCSTKSSDTELLAFVSSEEACSGFLHFKINWRGAKQGFATSVVNQHLKWVPLRFPGTRLSDNESETSEDVDFTKLVKEMSVTCE